jgi:hypothetical protein
MRTKFWLRSLKGRDHSEDQGVHGRIILKWPLGNRVGVCRLDSSGSGQEPVPGSCEHDNKPLG